MAKPIEDEALAKKLEAWRKRHVKANADARKANLDTGAEKKKRMDALYAEVTKAGVPLKAFKARMTALDHLDKAKGQREDVIDTEDVDVINAYDRLVTLSPDDLPLFDAATKAEIKKNAAKRPEPEDEKPDNVVPLRGAAE